MAAGVGAGKERGQRLAGADLANGRGGALSEGTPRAVGTLVLAPVVGPGYQAVAVGRGEPRTGCLFAHGGSDSETCRLQSLSRPGPVVGAVSVTWECCVRAGDGYARGTTITGGPEGVREPPAGSTVTSTASEPIGPPARIWVPSVRPGVMRPAGTIEPLSLYHSW